MPAAIGDRADGRPQRLPLLGSMLSPARILLVASVLVAFTTGACSDSAPGKRPEQVIFGGERPVQISIPADYDHNKKTPLLVVLHGYAVSGYLVLALTGLRDLGDDARVLLVAPEAVVGADGAPSWNIEGSCCNQHDTDDVAYISELVEEIASVYNVDRDRIYAFGHSNGGLMAYHLACERPDLFAAIASLAGPTVGSSCAPSQPVSILHVHGTDDDQVLIGGGNFSTGLPYQGAQAGLEQWAGLDGCGTSWQELEPLDIEVDLEGAETIVTSNASCPDGIGLALWKIEGGGHNPGFQDSFPIQLYDWLARFSHR